MSGLKLSKNQYAHLVRDIERLLKEHMSGGGLYDFSAPETLEYQPLSSLEFWVEDPEMEGGGFFSSIKKAANHVWGALQKSGIIDKGKDKLMKAGRELGGKAIDAAAKKADEVAKSKGFDASNITSKLWTVILCGFRNQITLNRRERRICVCVCALCGGICAEIPPHMRIETS